MNLNTGIIGGCMMCQAGLKLSDLYFRRFSHLVEEKYALTPRISFGFYKEFSKVPLITTNLFDKEPLDILIFQLRPAVYLARSEFLISDNREKYILNPLVKDRSNFAALETILEEKNPIPDPINNYTVWKKKGIWQLKKHNFQLGNLFSLSRNASVSALQLIYDLKDKCKKNNTKLIVLSPIPRKLANKNQNLAALNKMLIKNLNLANIPYVDIYSIIEKDKTHYLTDDCIHLNKKGHKLLAELIFESFQKHKADREECLA